MIPLRDSIPSRTVPVITYALIAINCLVFLYQVALPDGAERNLLLQLGLKPAFVTGYFEGDKVIDVPDETFTRDFWGNVYRREVQRPVRVDFWNGLFPFLTSMFLHGGIAHILGNMWFLWIFGDNVEDRFGRFRYLIFYLAAGILASLAQVIVDPGSPLPTIGASGAISGVRGAYMVSYPRARVLSLVPIGIIIPLFFEIPAVVFLVLWFAIQLVSGLLSSSGEGGVAFWAHVGGFVVGIAAAKLISPRSNPPRGWRVRDVPFEIVD